MGKTILVAGATGNLGFKIVEHLTQKGADIKVLVRAESKKEKISALEKLGAKVILVNNWRKGDLINSFNDVSCVISCLAGLRDVVIDAQKELLDAAIEAKVARFIPSDYSLDFTKFNDGENRNLDLRREFHKYLDKSPISATSIFNGAFADMLTNEMPLIFFKQKMILYWGGADHKWGLTTVDNTAEYTASVAMDSNSPRYLRIAGDQISPREIKTIVSNLTSEKFKMVRPGGKLLLGFMIKLVRTLSPGKNELYPAWQGMQYMHNMIDDRSNIVQLDNDRYPGIKWTKVEDLLKKHLDGNN